MTESIQDILTAASVAVLAALEAYRKSHRGVRVDLEVWPEEIEWTTPRSGRLKLRWREEIDLACRMERVGEGLVATVGFFREPEFLILEMLDEASQPQRSDEI